MKIGVSGAVGSFSEEAGEKYITDKKIENAEILQLVSVERVLKSIDDGSIGIGVFPIQNSTCGVIFEALEAISNHNFKIIESFELDVNHALIVKKGIKAEDIKKIASQLPALKQCPKYLENNWPNIELAEAADTAKAARDLSEGTLDSNTAVIAAARCASIYDGLEVLKDKIQDLKYNYTTFLAVEKL